MNQIDRLIEDLRGLRYDYSDTGALDAAYCLDKFIEILHTANEETRYRLIHYRLGEALTRHAPHDPTIDPATGEIVKS